MSTIHGIIAGAIATAPMTVFMLIAFYFLPRFEKYPLPPAEIVADITDKADVRKHLDSQQLTWLTMIAHFGFGGFAGGIYGFLASPAWQPYSITATLFCLCVWFVSYMIGLPTLGILRPATEHPARRNVLMIVAHVVWGVGLGWLFGWLQR